MIDGMGTLADGVDPPTPVSRAKGCTYDALAVGDRFHSRRHRIERDRILQFAEEFDPQPQHGSDAEWSAFGELVASGWHTAAISMRLFLEAFPTVDGGLQGGSIDRLVWPEPVRPGDDLRVEVEVVWMRVSKSKPTRGLVKLQVVTRNQSGRVVQEATHLVLMPRDGDGSANSAQSAAGEGVG